METLTSDPERLHFVLIPWLGPGRMIPIIDIARLLADRGATVSVITTPANASRIQPTIDRISNSGLAIHFIRLPFPSAEVGLPKNCENVDSIPSRTLFPNFYAGTKLLKDPLVLHLRNRKPGPSCIIADIAFAWAHDVAKEFGIPRLAFHGHSCFALLCTHNLHLHKTHETALSDSDPILLPGLPHRIKLARPQLPRQFHASNKYTELHEEIRAAELMADGVIVNSFDELEPEYSRLLEAATGKKAWMIGPVSLSNKGRKDMSERGNKAAVDESRILNWLDSKSPDSVIYVCFGSIGGLPPSQLMELGLGLLASARPFVWVIKSAAAAAAAGEVEKWLSEKFSDESRCLLIRGWAPQLMILSHPAIGGFVTHCGWNSTLEGLCAGVPMLNWPMFTEQFLNEKLAVEVLGVGVSVGVKMPTEWTGEVEDVVVVRREEVAEAVERLMDGGEEGEERRRKAKELPGKAKRALEDGGSSYLNLTLLIQYVINYVG